jgi:hypothetical protein
LRPIHADSNDLKKEKLNRQDAKSAKAVNERQTVNEQANFPDASVLRHHCLWFSSWRPWRLGGSI